MSERCVHDFEPGQCALCVPRPAAQPRVPAGPIHVISARYDGWCPECEEGIAAGDPIAHDDELDRWVHEECV